MCSLLHCCLVQVTRAQSTVNASIGAAKVGSRSEWCLQLAVKTSGAARTFVAVAVDVVQVDFTCATGPNIPTTKRENAKGKSCTMTMISLYQMLTEEAYGGTVASLTNERVHLRHQGRARVRKVAPVAIGNILS